MIAVCTTADQQVYYDGYHRSKIDLPVEQLKQAARLSALAKLTQGQGFGRALVIGCGRGADVTVLKAQATLALDLSWIAVRLARDEYSRALYLQADGTQLPFAPRTFHVVMCSEVIEHVLEPEHLVSEIARVLKPDGHLLLSTPNWVSWWGLARKLGELVLQRPITSGGQPIDNWFTTSRLHRTLSRHFIVKRRYGVWYFPPTGLGLSRLPDRLIAPIFERVMPLDHLLGRLVPNMGHLHVWLAVRRS